MPIPRNKAVVGESAFAHESGIHQHGMLKHHSTYEIMRPEDVGFMETGLVLGKHSGRHAFRVRLKALGIDLKDDELDNAFTRFKAVADKKKQVFDEDLISIAEEETKFLPNTWQLVSLAVTSGTKIAPKAVVSIKTKGKIFEKSSSGDGPVDACYKAIEQIVKVKGELLDYSIQSVTHGKDAMGEVTVKVRIQGKNYIGHGSSTDILEASAKAYLNAINKKIFQGIT